jgi:site-specific recombinase XerD
MIREALKDKRYRASSLGALVGRYIRWFRNEKGATPDSVRDYEGVLRRMALHLADTEPADITIEHLRDVIDTWAGNEPATRAKVVSILRSFWAWAEDEHHVPESPARRLKRPRKPKLEAKLLPNSTDAKVISAAATARDRLALMILTDCGVRRAELAGVQVRDIDVSRRTMVVTGKGRKARTIPLRGRIVLAVEEYLLEQLPEPVGRQPEPDDFVLYPEKFTPTGLVYYADPKRRKNGKGMHFWWYRMLRQAGLVGGGVTSGMNMHRARHTFAQSVRRVYPDMGVVQHLLGHSDPATTIALYGNYGPEDLECAMEAFAKALREAE